MKIPHRFKQISAKIAITLTATITAVTLLSPTVWAEGGGNAITDSVPFKGMMKMLSDGSVAMLLIAPIGIGILIGICSLAMAASTEPHDKERWGKNRKTSIITVVWVFGASAIVALVTSYFQ